MYRLKSSHGLVYLVLAACCMLYACNPMKQADKRAAQNTVTTLYPEMYFDSTVAKRAIAYGKSTIEGVIFTKPKNDYGFKAPLAGRIYGTNLQVTLFPVTPYFQEWYRLRKKKEGKRTQVYMSEDAFRWRITTNSDDYGRFRFERMLPGKYFLQTFISWNEQKSYKQYVGTGYGTYSTVDYYQWQSYYQNHSERLEEFVEVKSDGTIVKVKLK